MAWDRTAWRSSATPIVRHRVNDYRARRSGTMTTVLDTLERNG